MADYLTCNKSIILTPMGETSRVALQDHHSCDSITSRNAIDASYIFKMLTSILLHTSQASHPHQHLPCRDEDKDDCLTVFACLTS
jgi:hypothetical protein